MKRCGGLYVLAVSALAFVATIALAQDNRYRRAAEEGNPHAQRMLGVSYEKGANGVRQDLSQAANWYRRAADQGNADAQHRLGVMYAEGRGVPRDDSKAVTFIRKAAVQRLPGALYDLGHMYDKGKGVPRDDAQASLLYLMAAEEGAVTRAGFELSRMYADGEGVPQDNVQAYAWFLVAEIRSAFFFPERIARIENDRKVITETMSPDEIFTAQKLACDWELSYRFDDLYEIYRGLANTARCPFVDYLNPLVDSLWKTR